MGKKTTCIIMIILRKEFFHFHSVLLQTLFLLLFLRQKSSVLLKQGFKDQEVTIVPQKNDRGFTYFCTLRTGK